MNSETASPKIHLHQTIRHWREVARELSKATDRTRIGELIIEFGHAVAQQKPSK